MRHFVGWLFAVLMTGQIPLSYTLDECGVTGATVSGSVAYRVTQSGRDTPRFWFGYNVTARDQAGNVLGSVTTDPNALTDWMQFSDGLPAAYYFSAFIPCLAGGAGGIVCHGDVDAAGRLSISGCELGSNQDGMATCP